MDSIGTPVKVRVRTFRTFEECRIKLVEGGEFRIYP